MNQSNTQESRVALVTGAARRVGAAIARHLHQAGFRVAIHCHRSEAEAHLLANELNRNRRDSAHVFLADLMQKDKAYALIDQTIQWAKRLDLLVNNAAVFQRTSFDNPSDDTAWDTLFTTNVKAPFWLSAAANPHLAAQQGAIINITDIHADNPLRGYAVYCQSKAALTMQTKTLAREFAPNVRVNAVAPGAITWPEQDNALSHAEQQRIIEHTPLKQHGSPVFIAEAVLALAQNRFITGQTLRVDGGRSLRY